jgi:hypothetical protein
MKMYRESPSLLWNCVLLCSSRLSIILCILSLTAEESLFLLKINKAHFEVSVQGGRRAIALKRHFVVQQHSLPRNRQKRASKSDKLNDMEVDRVNHLEQISPEDWEKTPISVKKLVEEMAQQMEEQEKKLTEILTVQEQLLEKVNQTSKNSSLPPSSDPLGVEKKHPIKKSGKKRGAQPGHKGNSRELYPIEDCSSVIEHHPEQCPSCGEALRGSDINPYRHQIVEIPPISPIVVEHRLHQLTCSSCGTKTRATLPEDVTPTGYGVRVVALVALLSGVYRNSQRMVQSALLEVFGVSMSLGTVNKLRLLCE